VAVINGERLVIGGGGDGCVHAFKARTGEKVWTYKLEDGGGAINCSPVVQGNKVWIGHGEENDGNTQGRLVCLDAGTVKDGKPKLVWQHDGVKVKFAAPILHEGLLYVCDDAGKLYCFDADKGGDELWSFSYGRSTKGSPVWADGKIYVSEVDSKFHILKPSKEGCERLSQVRFPRVGIGATELHGAPAIVNGRVYFTTTQQLICIGKKGHKAAPDKIPAQPKEKLAGKEAHLTHIQVVPADATLKPGESVEFKAIGYDGMGRRMGEIEVQWDRAGVLPPVFPPGIPAPKPIPGAKPAPPVAGKLSSESGTTTTFTAAKMPNGQFGRVVAKVGKLTGMARVRVTPVLPYTMDFEKVPVGRTPAGWVNAPGKFSVVKLADGNQVLRKRNDTSNPIINNANAYLSDPFMSDYTIEADLFATKVRNQYMPDAGIGACQYVLSLHGNDQELRLVTWDAQKRLQKKMPFAFKPDQWYHLKLTSSVVDGKGIIKGKVWAKGDKEPSEWTIELEDPIPNTHGSPVIFGFASGAINDKNPGPEIHYDNVKITPNKK
jgi:outer membrane protein assembly factor BamB